MSMAWKRTGSAIWSNKGIEFHRSDPSIWQGAVPRKHEGYRRVEKPTGGEPR